MADEEGTEVAEPVDESPVAALREAREAADRNAKRAKSETDARQKIEQELAQVRGEIRAGNLTSILSTMGAPEGLATVYPSDAEVSEDAVTKWVKEGLGLTPTPKTSGAEWENYERIQAGTEPAGPGRTELEEMFAKGTQAITEMVTNYYDPSKREKVGETTAEFLKRAGQLQDEAEPGIFAGRGETLIDEGRGFGGPFDVPVWAQTAKAFHQGRSS